MIAIQQRKSVFVKIGDKVYFTFSQRKKPHTGKIIEIGEEESVCIFTKAGYSRKKSRILSIRDFKDGSVYSLYDYEIGLTAKEAQKNEVTT